MTELSSFYSKNKKLILVAVAALSLLLLVSSLPNINLSSISFNQSTQGLNFAYNSVQLPNGTFINQPSGLNYQLKSSYPIIGGDMGLFTVQPSSLNNRNYTWSIQNGTYNGQNVVDQYQANLVECNMAISVWLTGTGSQAGPADPTVSGLTNGLLGGGVAPDYQNYNIWLEITPSTGIAFANNPNQFYIAPCSIALTQNAVFGVSPVNGKGEYGSAPSISTAEIQANQATNPEQQGSTFQIYYALGGSPVSLSQAPSFEGQPLNSQLFQNQYFINLNLEQFQAVNTYNSILGGVAGHNWVYPSMLFNMQVYCWVVGEWTTYYTGSQVPTLVPHEVTSGGYSTGVGDITQTIFNAINNLLNLNLSWVEWVVIAIVALFGVYIYLNRKKNSKSNGEHTSRTAALKSSSGFMGISYFNWLILGALLFVDIFDIEIIGLDAVTDLGTLGYFIYVWRGRSKND